ncbi:MAG TPA: hypothetical protein VHK89_07315 [Actinomycetota bacterium]|jgi:hypothetical protein|nr:hypothetical protein [Actinomycetota bacterium]
MEADISGSQRKVVVSSVHPARRAQGTRGIPLKKGRTLPFVVARSWSAPAGVYVEQWYLVDPETREVLFESDPHESLIWGLQGLTEMRDEVSAALELRPGTYLVVFALGGLMGGELEVEAAEVSAEEAA